MLRDLVPCTWCIDLESLRFSGLQSGLYLVDSIATSDHLHECRIDGLVVAVQFSLDLRHSATDLIVFVDHAREVFVLLRIEVIDLFLEGVIRGS